MSSHEKKRPKYVREWYIKLKKKKVSKLQFLESHHHKAVEEITKEMKLEREVEEEKLLYEHEMAEFENEVDLDQFSDEKSDEGDKEEDQEWKSYGEKIDYQRDKKKGHQDKYEFKYYDHIQKLAPRKDLVQVGKAYIAEYKAKIKDIKKNSQANFFD